MYPTIADSFDAWVDADRGQKERIRIYDIQGQVLFIFSSKDYTYISTKEQQKKFLTLNVNEHNYKS